MLPKVPNSERAAIRIITGLITTAKACVGSAMKWIFEYVNLATIRSNSVAIGIVVIIERRERPLLLALRNGTKAVGATISLNVRPAVGATCALSCGRVGGVAALEE